MADEKMQNENKKSLNTREDNVAEDIRREAAGKDAGKEQTDGIFWRRRRVHRKRNSGFSECGRSVSSEI